MLRLSIRSLNYHKLHCTQHSSSLVMRGHLVAWKWPFIKSPLSMLCSPRLHSKEDVSFQWSRSIEWHIHELHSTFTDQFFGFVLSGKCNLSLAESALSLSASTFKHPNRPWNSCMTLSLDYRSALFFFLEIQLIPFYHSFNMSIQNWKACFFYK